MKVTRNIDGQILQYFFLVYFKVFFFLTFGNFTFSIKIENCKPPGPIFNKNFPNFLKVLQWNHRCYMEIFGAGTQQKLRQVQVGCTYFIGFEKCYLPQEVLPEIYPQGYSTKEMLGMCRKIWEAALFI